MGIIKTSKALELQKRFRWLLRPVAFVYAAVMTLRARLYASGCASVYSSRIFCISVGNIGWGGSGKTPLTEWLLSWAARQGLRAAVLSRGYGGKPLSLPWIVKTGDPASQTGDEPLLLALRHPEATVMVDPVRSRAARFLESGKALDIGGTGNATEAGGQGGQAESVPDMLILDDGFQHLALKRDIDLLLLRPEDLAQGWNQVIPAGSWREGSGALARASAFLCKTNPNSLPLIAPQFRERLAPYQRPLFCFELSPQGLRKVTYASGGLHVGFDDAELLQDIQGSPYVFAAGLAKPEEAAHSLEKFLGYATVECFFYEDHHAFDEKDVALLQQRALPVVCTWKDAVKLLPFWGDFKNTPLYVLESGVVFYPCLFTGRSFGEWWGSLFVNRP